MKALVTGGTGFIGRPVVARLQVEGHQVTLFSRRSPVSGGLQRGEMSFIQGDLKEPGPLLRSLDGADVLYHIGEIRNISRADAKKNVDLVKAILQHSFRAGLKRLVFISSISVAGIPSRLPATEETEPAISLRDHYTEGKRLCERVLLETTSGPEVVIVRPAPVYGAGSVHMARLVRMIGTLGPIGVPFIGDARNQMPLIHVLDLAEAIVRAGTEPAAAEQVFNLTDGGNHSWLDFFSSIGEALGKKVRVAPIPPLLLKIGAAPLGAFASLLGFDLDVYRFVDYISRDLRFSSDKAERLLGWRPRRSLAEATKEMVQDALRDKG